MKKLICRMLVMGLILGLSTVLPIPAMHFTVLAEDSLSVSSVTPSGTGVAISGNVVITFSDEMEENAGTVTLVEKDDPDKVDMLSGVSGSWDSTKKIFTIQYNQLKYNTKYDVTISGFKSAEDESMEEAVSRNFTTIAKLVSITQPNKITGVPNGTAKTALGLPTKVGITTSSGSGEANVTWAVDSSDYDPEDKAEQEFTITGTVTLPAGVVNPDNIVTTISVTVKAAKVLKSIPTPTPITNVENGVAKTASALGLPTTIKIVTLDGDSDVSVDANVLWSVDASSYDRALKTEQTFTVTGTVTLPTGVVNSSSPTVSLTTTISVTVKAATVTDKVLTGITPPAAITNVANGAAKTAAALGLPAKVTMTTSGGNVEADVTWNVAGSSYDSTLKTEQIFTVTGTVALPTGVVNSSSIPLTTTIIVTVKAADSSADQQLITSALGKLPAWLGITIDGGDNATDSAKLAAIKAELIKITEIEAFNNKNGRTLDISKVTESTWKVALAITSSGATDSKTITVTFSRPGSSTTPYITIRNYGTGGLGQKYGIIIENFEDLNLPDNAVILVAISKQGSRQSIMSYRAGSVTEVSCNGTASKIEVWLADGMINLINSNQGLGTVIYGSQSWIRP